MRPIVNFGSEIGLIRNAASNESIEFSPRRSSGKIYSETL
jgi:hypothetical protein